MRIINYKEVIRESVEELLSIEKKQTKARLRDRVRFIRLLKAGTATTQVEAGAIIGLKRRQSQLLWQHYTQDGLVSLVTTHYKGSWAKLDSVQQARLLQRLDSDAIFTQQQVIDWIKAEMGITYSQSGIALLLARLKVKLKTGRPVNVRKDEAAEMSFKKTLHNYP
jgi:transposase